MFIVGSAATVIGTIKFLIKIAAIIVIAIIAIKGIKYLKRAEARERGRDYREAQRTIDDIEQELHNKRD